MVGVFSCLSFLNTQKRKKEKRLYLEERKIPVTNMTKETETATEIERKQMMIERWVYLYDNPAGVVNRTKPNEKLNESIDSTCSIDC